MACLERGQRREAAEQEGEGKREEVAFDLRLPQGIASVKGIVVMSGRGSGESLFRRADLRAHAKELHLALFKFAGNPMQRGFWPQSLLFERLNPVSAVLTGETPALPWNCGIRVEGFWSQKRPSRARACAAVFMRSLERHGLLGENWSATKGGCQELPIAPFAIFPADKAAASWLLNSAFARDWQAFQQHDALK